MKLYQVDAFAGAPFKGNPAGVCVLGGPAGEQWMQDMAMEMNLSETAFLHPAEGGYNLRWFTPKAEVSLCGHATLASAHVLWETGELAEEAAAVFFTKSGRLAAEKEGGRIVLDFPAREYGIAENGADVARALGANVLRLAKARNNEVYLAELNDEAAVRSVCPDMEAIVRAGIRGVIVTARAESAAYDFVSRFFAPLIGIPEDPVTGSAHCFLGPYWRDMLGKPAFTARQVSRRGGELRVEVRGGRVRIGGTAVTVFKLEPYASAASESVP